MNGKKKSKKKNLCKLHALVRHMSYNTLYNGPDGDMNYSDSVLKILDILYLSNQLVIQNNSLFRLRPE